MKKIKVLLASIFALSLGLTAVSFSYKENSVTSVSALSFDGDNPLDESSSIEEPVSSEDSGAIDSGDDNKEEPTDNNEESQSTSEDTSTTDTPIPEQEAPKAEGEQTSGVEEKTSSTESKDSSDSNIFKDILWVIKNTFKDALKDLKAHIKKWLKLN